MAAKVGDDLPGRNALGNFAALAVETRHVGRLSGRTTDMASNPLSG